MVVVLMAGCCVCCWSTTMLAVTKTLKVVVSFC
jgi:hypothetical protein